MDHEQAFMNYIWMLRQVIKLAPSHEKPGLNVAYQMALAAMRDVSVEEEN